ncbi:NADH dehydrogenase (ubiquinone) B14.7 subunit [Leptinotarsa decemlineata]|uniref:NADH dehydrogenase (ubiquinone) B14.7 subunit n=1 Tax=Leptinotarsa decemlineata TaxID=7539 RepID=UPI000C252A92|nr:NADH dehydrogenase [ubiquinone] 1 alpha subcomplex subunit 11 [Leptinotarsa decemlineata]
MSEKNPEIRPYKYFDTPDGHDVFKKYLCLLKPAGQVTAAAGIFDVVAWSHPKGYLPILGRFVYVGTPIIGATTAFVFTTNGLASLRNKDDKLNWFLGGFAAGALVGAWRGKTMFGFNLGMLFGLMAVVRKYSEDRGWQFSPPNGVPIMNQGIWQYDFSLFKERPRTWTTGKD